jgi:hypothetical protein
MTNQRRHLEDLRAMTISESTPARMSALSQLGKLRRADAKALSGMTPERLATLEKLADSPRFEVANSARIRVAQYKAAAGRAAQASPPRRRPGKRSLRLTKAATVGSGGAYTTAELRKAADKTMTDTARTIWRKAKQLERDGRTLDAMTLKLAAGRLVGGLASAQRKFGI